MLACRWWAGSPALGNGAGDDRETLPDGAGSVGGGGGNASVNTAQGSLSLSFPVEVPQGFEGLTPQLAFSYCSGGGGMSVLGIGWSLAQPSIERMTNRGVPKYDDDDRIAVECSAELVRIGAAEPAEYRFRFEGAFSRIRWPERGTGDAGFWTVEGANGFVSFYAPTKTACSSNQRLLDATGNTAAVSVVGGQLTITRTWMCATPVASAAILTGGTTVLRHLIPVLAGPGATASGTNAGGVVITLAADTPDP